MPRRMTKDAISKAQRALRVFRSMQPTLNAYARMLTGRPDVRVEADPHNNGSTDGKRIFYRPPISLGDDTPHRAWLCNKRGDDEQMLCAACAKREDVLTTIYHEIGHIWFDSFSPMTDTAKKKVITESITMHGSKYSEGVARVLDKRGSYMGYMELARLISPFFPLLLNALEDARVNRELFKALPGTKVMFDANTRNIFTCGVEQIDESGNWSRDMWSTRPLNLQAMIGVFCMASGYVFDEWLDKFVVESLADPTLISLVSEITKLDSNSSIDATFSLAFPVLARLRELGFMRDEDDPDDDFDPPYEEEPEEPEKDSAPTPDVEESEESSDPEEGDGADSGIGEPSESSEEGAGSGDDSARSDDRGDGGGSEPGDATDEPADDEEEVTDDNTGGDQPGERTDRSEADGEESDGADGDSSADPGDSAGGDAGEAGSDEVSEADSGGDPAGAVGAAGPGGADDLRDLEGPRGGLDGSDGETSGDEDRREPGDRADNSGDPGERSDLAEGVDATDDGDELADEVAPVDVHGGEKAIRVDERVRIKPNDLEWGTAEEIEPEVMELGDHEMPSSIGPHSHGGEAPHEHRSEEDEEGDEAVKAVIISGVYFEMPSVHVTGVQVLTEEGGAFEYRLSDRSKKYLGFDSELVPSEQLIGPALLRARVVFAENRRGRRDIGQRHGRVHGPSLARKAPVNDDRLFARSTRPGRTDYFVGIGIDCSGSTVGVNIDLAKKVAFAEAEVLSRLGIPFSIYGHTGTWGHGTGGMELVLIEIKRGDEPWTDKTRSRLSRLGPRAANLDGHTLSAYRKMLLREGTSSTRRIMHYYSDGSMPCENYSEELSILTEEIQRYKQAGIVLPCVGIRTNAPAQHGLHTVEVHRPEDVLLVVNDLEKHLTK